MIQQSFSSEEKRRDEKRREEKRREEKRREEKRREESGLKGIVQINILIHSSRGSDATGSSDATAQPWARACLQFVGCECKREQGSRGGYLGHLC